MHYTNFHVVTAVANPIGWSSRIRLFQEFAERMISVGVPLTVVECAYGNQKHQCSLLGINHIGVRAKSVLWHKEALLNLGINYVISSGASQVGWFDADICFLTRNWVERTIATLYRYDVIQPWAVCRNLGPDGKVLGSPRSFSYRLRHGGYIEHNGGTSFPHPGFAWAATADALRQTGGLLDTAIMGSADAYMAYGLIGRTEEALRIDGVTDGYRSALLRWQERARGLKIGFADCEIEHMWHGSLTDRHYINRRPIVVNHQFDPDVDLVRNDYGIYEWAGNKPDLERDVLAYFKSRREDSVTL